MSRPRRLNGHCDCLRFGRQYREPAGQDRLYKLFLVKQETGLRAQGQWSVISLSFSTKSELTLLNGFLVCPGLKSFGQLRRKVFADEQGHIHRRFDSTSQLRRKQITPHSLLAK